MKSRIFALIVAGVSLLAASPAADAQFNISKALNAGVKAVQAFTLSRSAAVNP